MTWVGPQDMAHDTDALPLCECADSCVNDQTRDCVGTNCCLLDVLAGTCSVGSCTAHYY
jgi:hypothetical protein